MQTESTSSISVFGEIESVVSSSEFVLENTQCGYEPVYLNGSTTTTTNGLTIKTGVYASVSGTGSCSTSVTASTVTLLPAISIGGDISEVVSSSEFILADTQCGHEPVYTNSSTKTVTNGLSIKVGVYASVVGGGSCSTSVTASSVTLSSEPLGTSTTAQDHIATWAFDEYWAEGENATTAQVQKYLTYAEGGQGNGKAVTDCSGSGICSSVFYLAPNLIESGAVCSGVGNEGFTAAAAESWYVHETGYTNTAHRLQGYYDVSCNGATVKVPVYVANGDIAGVQSYFKSYLQEYGDSFDYYWMDATDWSVIDQMYGPGGGFCPWETDAWCTTSQELPTDASVVAEHGALANASNHTDGSAMKFFTNTMDTSPSQEAAASSRFVGGVCENCVVDEGTPRPAMYAPILTLEALTDATPGMAFVELNDGNSSAGSSTQIEERLITTAVAWLGYSEGHTVVFPNLEDNTNNLAVWPEDMLYPTEPVESMSSSASDIAVATNVWRREFTACYNDGTAIGPCAVILNGNASAVTVSSSWLKQTYGHKVTLSGGDALDGGSISLTSTTFTAGSTSVPADQAILVVR